MDVAKKLEEYRKKQAKNYSLRSSVIMENDKDLTEKLIPETSLNKSLEPESDNENFDEEDSLQCKCTNSDLLHYGLYGLCFIVWCILYIVFIKLQFGTVFFIVSCLIGIYLNTRTSPKKKGEVSAYSVFNKDCKSIDGTLNAEQFEREIRYGPSIMY